MASEPKLRVAIVGLGFGAEFIPIYQAHPNAEIVAVCRRNKAELDKTADKYGIPKRFTSYEELLKDPDIDAVHINSPIPDHGPQSVAALKAGKHVACTVPMATTKEQIREIVELQRKTGKVYMMMETVVYAREYLFARELYEKGELGRVQFLRGSHQQDMDGWPDYWPGLPPMWYATHCVSPCLALLSKPGAPALAGKVSCYGSGRIREELVPKYNSPFAVETATFSIKGSDVCAEVTRSLFDVARQYRESFDVTGSKKSFEWQQVEGEDPILHTAKKPEPEIPARVKVPDFALLAWLAKDELIERLEGEVDERSDDEHALSDEDRAARLAAIEAECLAVGRDEEHFIEAAAREGFSVQRRPDADPRAVLALSGDLPAPREHH